MKFCLVEQPWLPVMKDTHLHKMGIRDALLEAHSITGLHGETPLMTVALLRLLLAILTDALKPVNTKQVAGWCASGIPKRPIEEYLEAYGSHFNLFDRKRPFYQAPYLQLNHTWTQLSLTHNKASTAVLFDHTSATDPHPLSPAAAARHLVTDQTFTLSSGQTRTGYSSSGPLSRGAIINVVSSDLHKTFCLNMVPQPESAYETDAPVWRRESDASKRPGLLELYTPRSRRVRLQVPPTSREGVVRIAYERGERCVSTNDPMLLTQKRKDRHVPVKITVKEKPWLEVLQILGNAENKLGVLKHAIQLIQHSKQQEKLHLAITSQSTLKPARGAFISRDHISLDTEILTDQTQQKSLVEFTKYLISKGRWLGRERAVGTPHSLADTYWARLKAYCLHKLAQGEVAKRDDVDTIVDGLFKRQSHYPGAAR